MPRNIPVGNGQMLVTFDQHYRVRDLYYPHVGQENHAGGSPCRFGVWADIPENPDRKDERRRKRLYWSDEGWDINLGYRPETLATDVRMRHDAFQLELRCSDVADFHRPVMVRRIEVANLTDQEREVRLFHQHDFQMYGTKVGDTAYYDPQLRSLIHYRRARYIMTCFYLDGEQQIDEYATGNAGFGGAEGTYRDAEDGHLGMNSIAQGAVDSTMMVRVQLPANGMRVVYLVIGCGHKYDDLEQLHRFLHRETPQGVVDRTVSYWRLWLAATRTDLDDYTERGLSKKVVDLFKRSLLVVRTQIDNTGAIIAANDSDIMQFSRDTYSYLWPRDGAYVADAMDAAGFPNVSRSFLSLCAKIINDQGYFLHKYNPDGSLASSWHPWVSNGRPQLPIQEDETALVLWAAWRHYVRYRDIEFMRPLWIRLIQPAGDFLVRFRDPETHLPLPSWDLWEERWGVHAFTVATVYAGLKAAWQFAVCFGDHARASRYSQAAEQVRSAFCKHLWSEKHGRFLRRIVPLDHDRTAGLMAEVMAGRDPTASHVDLNGATDTAKNGNGDDHKFEVDETLDASMYAIFGLGLLPVDDKRVTATMDAIEKRLWIKTDVGGVARYEDDYYHQVTRDTENVPGNPWFICTLWLADYYIARAQDVDQLNKALPIMEWVANRALPSGVLAEQVHPETNAPLSVSPLTWSHATVVSTVMQYLSKLDEMSACESCGQPHQSRLPDARLLRRQSIARKSTMPDPTHP
ncbi:glycoside hydrolase family 15 protein [Phycisphaerales bacterium AB-hyl4]|uniref:Glycoside hydrolase family 15 protein n=1 Tax=Natronomicrosphaera hydrolytica TaxID=3242702 RepID=A0ABV4U2L8_9BACT